MKDPGFRDVSPGSLKIRSWDESEWSLERQGRQVCSLPLALADPKVVSLKVEQFKFKVSSFQFFGPNADSVLNLASTTGPPKRNRFSDGAKRQPRKSKVTRIAPPRDVIKLQDRMFYLLQPPQIGRAHV